MSRCFLRPAPASVLLACVALLACTPAEQSARSDTTRPDVRVAAPAPASYVTVETIKARVDSIDRYLKEHPGRLKVYAAVEGGNALIPVKDSTAWPENVEASINILADSAGTVLLHREMPTSESGDWFAAISHYLAPDGRTIYYEFEISSFSSGCTEILRETKRLYFDPTFAVLKEELSFADKDWNPISPPSPEECLRRSDSAPPAARSVAQLKVR
jgi:hypothetical protein